MLRRVHLAFTGVVVLAPAYPGPGRAEADGPIYILMPNSPRARRFQAFDLEHPERTVDVSAHLAFAVFPYENLVLTPGYRGADYKFPNETVVDKGVCFFHRESLKIDPPPNNTTVLYVEGDTTGVPNRNAIAAGWIADWKKFAPDPNDPSRSVARFYDDAIKGEGDFVRLVLPGGVISSRFACDPPPKAVFPYGAVSQPPRFFAHEIVVTLTFAEETTGFTLCATAFAGSQTGPTDLAFEWGDATDIRITFANGVVASMNNVLGGSCAGHDHEGRADHEFQLLYKDVILCPEDDFERKPVPVITSKEILRIPCLASMIEANNGEQSQLVSGTSGRKLSGRKDQTGSRAVHDVGAGASVSKNKRRKSGQ